MSAPGTSLTEQARAWLAGLDWNDTPALTAEDFAALTAEQVQWHADRQYPGGWDAFTKAVA